MATELGVAYVTIAPSLRGVDSATTRQLDQMKVAFSKVADQIEVRARRMQQSVSDSLGSAADKVSRRFGEASLSVSGDLSGLSKASSWASDDIKRSMDSAASKMSRSFELSSAKSALALRGVRDEAKLTAREVSKVGKGGDLYRARQDAEGLGKALASAARFAGKILPGLGGGAGGAGGMKPPPGVGAGESGAGASGGLGAAGGVAGASIVAAMTPGLSGVIGGIATNLTAAALGGGAFALALKGVYSQSKPAQTAVSHLNDAYKGWVSSLAGSTVPVFVKGIGALTDGMHLLTPLVKGAAPGISAMVGDFDRLVKAPATRQFFDYLGNVAGRSLSGLGKLMSGFATVAMKAFRGLAPETRVVGRAFSAIGDWLQKANVQKAMSQFGEAFRRSLPYVGKMGAVLVDLFEIVAPLMQPLAALGRLLINGLYYGFKIITPVARTVMKVLAGVLSSVLDVANFDYVGAVKGLFGVVKTARNAWQAIDGGFVKPLSRWFSKTFGSLMRTAFGGVRVGWQAFSGAARGLWADISRPIRNAWSGVFGKGGAVRSGWNIAAGFLRSGWRIFAGTGRSLWRGITNPIKSVWSDLFGRGGPIRATWDGVSGFLRSSWRLFAGTAKTLWKGVTGPIKAGWNDLFGRGGPLRGTWSGFASFQSGAWRFYSGTASRLWKGITGGVKGDWDRLFGRGGDLRTAWNNASSWLANGWRNFEDTADRIWKRITGKIGGAFGALVGEAKKVWRNVSGAFQHGVTVVKTDIDKWFIRPVNKALHVVDLSIPTLATGGKVGAGFKTNGPAAIVGEGRASFPEYVIPSDPKYRRNAVSLLGQAMQSMGLPMMAGGGWLGKAIGAVRGWAGGELSHVINPLAHGVERLLGAIPPPMVGKLASGAVRLATQDIIKWVAGKQAASGRGAGGPGRAVGASYIPTGQHMALLAQALKLAGLPVTKANAADVNLIVRYESGWNPRAINLTDSNAAAGHPSQGLMQTIPSTFEAYRNRSLPNVITNPLANLVAGMRYAVARYGSLGNIPGVRSVAAGGAYKGYASGGVLGAAPLPVQVLDRGGWLPEGVSVAVNNTGAPERVPGPRGLRDGGDVVGVKFENATIESAVDMDVINRRAAFQLRSLGL